MTNKLHSKGLLKNATFLYIKVALSMIIAVFFARILLQVFGEDDFGLYGLVSGVLTFLFSLRVLFSGAIQRFINVSNGEDNIKKMNGIFNMGILIHLLLALIFLVFAESVGLWYVNHILVIDPERLHAANMVYHFSVFSTLLYILAVPYDAIIIAHERIKFYSIISTLELFSKLLIILGLPYVDYDYLIAYAFLLLINVLLFRLIIFIYCNKKLTFYSYDLKWDKGLFRELSSFSGWTFLGNTSYMISHEGINQILNLFANGTGINAAKNIASSVLNALNQFVGSIILAIKPRAMTLFAKEREAAYAILFFSTRCAFFILLAIVFPLTLFLDFYLELWLDNVPQYSGIFSKLLIVYILIRVFHDPINVIFQANGDIKTYQIFESISLVAVIPIAALLLYFGFPYHSAFVVLVIIEIFTITIDLILLKRMVNLNLQTYFTDQLKQPLTVALVIIPIYFGLHWYLNTMVFSSVITVLALSALCFFIVVSIAYWLGFSTSEKQDIKLVILKFKNKIV